MRIKKHYILLKTHNKTGLQYLCKHVTSYEHSCYSYSGSGVYWKRHLDKHGYDFSTVILAICETKNAAQKAGRIFSKFYDVVASKKFANLVPEDGQGGADVSAFRKTKSSWRGFKMLGDKNPSKREDVKTKISKKLKGRIFTNEWKEKISKSCKNRVPHNKGKKELTPRTDTHIYKNRLISCIYCKLTGSYGAMVRWHLQNCKLCTDKQIL